MECMLYHVILIYSLLQVSAILFFCPLNIILKTIKHLLKYNLTFNLHYHFMKLHLDVTCHIIYSHFGLLKQNYDYKSLVIFTPEFTLLIIKYSK